MSDAEKLELCQRVVRHVLIQVQDRSEFRYIVGPGTESFRRLITAWAALQDTHPDEMESKVLSGCRQRDEIVRVIRLVDLNQRLRREGLTEDTRRTVLRECGFDGDEINAAIGGAK